MATASILHIVSYLLSVGDALVSTGRHGSMAPWSRRRRAGDHYRRPCRRSQVLRTKTADGNRVGRIDPATSQVSAAQRSAAESEIRDGDFDARSPRSPLRWSRCSRFHPCPRFRWFLGASEKNFGLPDELTRHRRALLSPSSPTANSLGDQAYSLLRQQPRRESCSFPTPKVLASVIAKPTANVSSVLPLRG